MAYDLYCEEELVAAIGGLTDRETAATAFAADFVVGLTIMGASYVGERKSEGSIDLHGIESLGD